MRNNYLIVDFFVDEPACFGVPPFISPYPRYVYAALVESGISESDIKYITIDYLRDNGFKLDKEYSKIIVIGGAVVPGKYLGEKIGTLTELKYFINSNPNANFVIGGLIGALLEETERVITPSNSPEEYIYNALSEKTLPYNLKSKIAHNGSKVVNQHPDFPNLIAEIETYTGCPRQSHCSFCSESLKTEVKFREIEDIINEIETLCKLEIKRFRIGRQADILCYQSKLNNFKNGFPEPNEDKVIELFESINNLKEKYHLLTLNVDNANPGTIINFPEISYKILKKIADTVTAGDTIPLGVESFDPDVVKANNLKGYKDDIIQAIRIINQAGAYRENGVPKLLPGINVIHGLRNENMKTFKMNYDALSEILDEGLLVKRINIRKLLPFPGTPLFNNNQKISAKVSNRYEYYKQKIRKDIDRKMLEKIYPAGTVLKNLRAEKIQDGHTLLKQIASYSITCKIADELIIDNFYDVIVCSHRERSLICLSLPLKINSMSAKEISSIPGISNKLSGDIVLQRPFKTIKEFIDFTENKLKDFYKYIEI